MSIDDVALYFDPDLGFAESVTLAGATKTGIFDLAAEILLDDVISTAPAFAARTEDVSGAAAGQTLIRGASTYKVRQVLPLPPDGAVTRLILARA